MNLQDSHPILQNGEKIEHHLGLNTSHCNSLDHFLNISILRSVALASMRLLASKDMVGVQKKVE
jgi:hypothetical protein